MKNKIKINSNKNYTLRVLSLLLCLAVFSAFGVGCAEPSEENELNIVCTVFPIYDWTKNIVGEADGVSVELLVSNGADLHSYQASVSDIIALKKSDLVISVGGESDAWVEAAIGDSEVRVLRLLDLLERRGLALHSEEDEHSHAEDCDHSLDEHIWLSPSIASLLCEEIEKEISALEGFDGDLSSNLSDYKKRLGELDAEYKYTVQNSARKPLIFADRFPFKYLTESYSLEYFAAFSSCSSDSEASFETVKSLANACDSIGAEYILTLEGSTDGIADAVISATKSKTATILRLNSMQSVTQSDIDSGADYIEIMKSNLALIKTALGQAEK